MRTAFQAYIAAFTIFTLPAAGQISASPGQGFTPAFDSSNSPLDPLIGSVPATVGRIRALIDDLSVGSGLYGSCTKRMSKGDLAALELVKIGRPAVELLISTVKELKNVGTVPDSASNQRWFAVRILGRIGDARAVSALGNCLRNEPVPFVRAYAPLALESLHDPRSEDALLAGLNDPFPDIQASSAHALGQLRSRRAIPSLIALLGELDRAPAIGANINQQSLISPAPAAALALAQIGLPSVPALQAALSSKDPQIHRYAAAGLAFNAAPEANAYVRALLKDLDAAVRLAAARGESNRRDPSAVPLLAVALQDSDPQINTAAGIALADSGGLSGVKALLSAANDAGVEALRSVRDPQATDLLLAAVIHGKGRMRHSAAEALLTMNDPRAVQLTLDLLKDTDPVLRANAVWLVNQLKDKRAFPALVKAMDDPDEKVRIVATELLGTRDSIPSVVPLLRRLKDPAELVRLYAIYGLGKAGGLESMSPLQSLLARDTPRVQDAARKALEAIQSRSKGAK